MHNCLHKTASAIQLEEGIVLEQLKHFFAQQLSAIVAFFMCYNPAG
jgi:hypothetical protein